MTRLGALRIAVADNSAVVRGVVNALPATEAVVCAHARSRAQLERVVEGQSLDAIICGDDLSGPLVGVEALRQLRELKKVPLSTAFVLLVHNASRDHLLACAQVKPDAMVLKPFSLETLSRRLHRAVACRRSLGSLRQLEDQRAWEALLAEARFRQADVGGGYAVAAQYEAKALAMLGKTAEADQLYEDVLRRTPGLLWAEEALARRELERGFPHAAEARLLRLVRQHPGHAEAHELLYGLKLNKKDLSGAQEHLSHLVRVTGSLQRQRELGDLAILNGHPELAGIVYARAARAEYNPRAFEDHVNVTRALLLNGDALGASQQIANYRGLGHKDVLIPLLDSFVGGARARFTSHLGQAQASVLHGVRALETHTEPPIELRIMAIESCLMTALNFQASEQSRRLLMDFARPMLELRTQWVLKLHDWARMAPDDRELPPGLQGCRRLLH